MTLEANEAPVRRYVPPSKERIAELAEERAERRRQGTMRPVPLAPFDVKTPDLGHWEGRFWVPDWPTHEYTRNGGGGMPFPPSKRQARVSSSV
jgi:hypothetical protein